MLLYYSLYLLLIQAAIRTGIHRSSTLQPRNLKIEPSNYKGPNLWNDVLKESLGGLARNLIRGVGCWLNLPRMSDAGRDPVETYEIQTTMARISGRVEGNIVRFLGIPYAKAPAFASPIPYQANCRSPTCVSLAESADELFKAHHFGPRCPATEEKPGLGGIFQPRTTELWNGLDCLNLNVYRPRHVRGKLPVLFWVHGGTYSFGSNSDPFNDPSNLVALNGGMVIVVINYRLGPYGFMYFGDDAQPVNFAMEDVLTALRWNREHIASFGGDPNNVTLGGFSAGGNMVNWQAILAAQSGEVLFHRLYMMSGNYQVVPLASKEEAMHNTLSMAEATGFKGEPTPAALRQHFDGIQPEDLIMVIREKKWMNIWRPIMDGRLIKQSAEGYLADGTWPKSVPTLFTTVSEDASFVFKSEEDWLQNLSPVEEYHAALRKIIADEDVLTKVQNAFPLRNHTLLNRLVDVVTELVFRCPDLNLVNDLRSKGAKAWYAEHRINYAAVSLMAPAHMGTFHSLDQMALFGVLASSVALFEGTPMHLMQSYLHNFMVHGTPTTDDGHYWARSEFHPQSVLRCQHLMSKPGSPVDLVVAAQSIYPPAKTPAMPGPHRIVKARIPVKKRIGMLAPALSEAPKPEKMLEQILKSASTRPAVKLPLAPLRAQETNRRREDI